MPILPPVHPLSFLNRSGICEELSVVIRFVHAAVLRMKIAFNFGKNTSFIPYYGIDSVKRN